MAEEKIVEHISGGCMQGVFSCGAQVRLTEVGLPGWATRKTVAVSVGATSGTYVAAGQIRQGWNFPLRHMREMIKKKWGLIPYFDQGSLERAYREGDDKLDIPALRASKQKVWMALSDPETSGTHFACINDEEDPVATLLKGTQMAISWPRTQPGKRYLDGGHACQPPYDPPHMEGATQLWFISHRPMGYRIGLLETWLYKLLGCLYGLHDPQVGKLLYYMPARSNACQEAFERLPKLHVIAPKKVLPIGWRHTDLGDIKAVIQMGRQAVDTYLLENKL